MTQLETQTRAGVLTAFIRAEHPERIDAAADACDWIDMPDGTRALMVQHHNAYVKTGLNNALAREFGVGGTAVGFIGVSSSSSAVTADTRFLNGATAGVPGTGGAGGNTVIKAISPAAVLVADTAALQQVVAGATFAHTPGGATDFPGGVFVLNKVGLTLAATDTDGKLVDVIGGSAGTAPYDRAFTLNLTSAGQFTATLQIAVTATAS